MLVFFVSGPVDDATAARVRERVTALARSRPWAGTAPGFFDDPAAEEPGLRTTGCYLRAAAAEDAAAMWAAALAISAELGVTVEIQWREAILGHVRDGEPDPGLDDAVRAIGRPAS